MSELKRTSPQVSGAGGEASTRSPGRPADPRLESRLFDAVLEIYAESGWAGFHLHKVAARGKVGKAAIYRRWASKEELLVDALMSVHDRGLTPDTGSLRGDLLATVVAELKEYFSPHGLVILRAQVEAKAFPDLLGQAMERIRRNRNAAGDSIIRAAVARGELNEGESHTVLLDAIGGMTLNHFLASSEKRLDLLRSDSTQFAEMIVDFALKASE